MQRGDTLFVIEKMVILIAACLLCGHLEAACMAFSSVVEVLRMSREYDAAMKRASRSYFIRPDLLFPKDSPYYKALDAGNTGAFISLVRMPKEVFEYILRNMDPDWVAHHDGFTDRARMHRRSGRPHMLDARAILALTLCWYGTSAKMPLLELVFGVGHSVLDRDLKLGRAELLATLRRLRETDCALPDFAKMAEFAEVIAGTHGPNPYPSSKVWGFIDGLRLEMLNPDDALQQTFFYNGWIKITNVVCVFVFTPDGKICLASINSACASRFFHFEARALTYTFPCRPGQHARFHC